MANEELRHALALLASQNAKLLAKPKRDGWDKLSIFAPLIAGLVITLTSLWITHRFEVIQKERDDLKTASEKAATRVEKERSEKEAARESAWRQRLSRTELLNKFIPYLTANEQQSSMAIIAISIAGDPELTDAVSRMVPSKGVKEGLAQVAAKGPTEEIRARASTTLNLIETLERAKPSLDGVADSIRSRVLRVALEELKRGVKEDPPGSNRGPDVDKYNRSAGVPTGSPWSGSFLFWCYNQTASKGGKLPVQLSPSLQETMQRLIRAGRWKPKESGYTPQPGDIALFQFGSWSSHGGIVVSIDDKHIYTIEGNTTPSDDAKQGEAVAGKARLLTQVKGYGDMTGDTP